MHFYYFQMDLILLDSIRLQKYFKAVRKNIAFLSYDSRDQMSMTSKTLDKLQEGIEFQTQGDLLKAEAIYRQILEESPEHPDALHLLGVLAYQINDHEVAEDLIRHAISINDKVADYYNNLGEVLRVTGKLTEAEKNYQQALEIDPKHPNAKNNLETIQKNTIEAVVENETNSDEAPENSTEPAETHLSPEDVEAQLQQGMTYQTSGELQEAEAIYRNILDEYPEHPDALHLLGVLALQIEDYEVAEDLITHAISINQEVADYYNNLGEVMRQSDRIDEAEQCYQKALEIDPEHQAAQGNLIAIQSQNEEEIQAEGETGDNPALADNQLFELLQQGMQLQNDGDLQQAEKIYLQILEEHPDHPDALHLLGVLAIQIQDYEVAENLISRAIDTNETVADYYNNLGQVFRNTNRTALAIDQFNKALELDPGHEQAKTSLRQIKDNTVEIIPPKVDSSSQIPEVRHAIPSYLLSLDDEPNKPSQMLIDLALLAAHQASQTQLDHIQERFAPEHAQFINVWPGEHYRLLAVLVDILKPKRVIEIGTATGASALTMKSYLPIDSKLITYDIIPWQEYPGCGLNEDDFDSQMEQRIVDLSNPAQAQAELDTLAGADIIFADAAKDNIMEQKFCDLFDSINFAKPPLIIFDDIRMMAMLKVWRGLQHPKLDLTSFGHWSGTGLVEWK